LRLLHESASRAVIAKHHGRHLQGKPWFPPIRSGGLLLHHLRCNQCINVCVKNSFILLFKVTKEVTEGDVPASVR
jgi:hypothetical protein